MKNLIALFYIVSSLFLHEIGFSQSLPGEIISNSLYSNTKNIINGTKWVFDRKYRGVPFLVESYWPEGNITYNGEDFENIRFNYDLYTDELIIFIPEEGNKKYIALQNKYLEGFSFKDNVTNKKRTFTYFQVKGTKEKKLYEIAYKGNVCDFLIHHNKTVNTKVADGFLGDYVRSVELFVNINGKFKAFSNKKTLLQALGEHSAELKQYIRSNHLKINKKHYEDSVSVIEYFDRLEGSGETEN